jgi:hypothetical protein
VKHLHYWAILNQWDQQQSSKPHMMLNALSFGTARSHAPRKPQITIEQVKRFLICHDVDDWMNEAVAISIRQISMLLGKSKPSINPPFQHLDCDPQ